MSFKQLFFVCTIFYCFHASAGTSTIAINGISGFVGSSLLYTLDSPDIRLGSHRNIDSFRDYKHYHVGSISDPTYLRSFLKGVDILYHMAAIASVEPSNTLKEYILTNSLGPYLASRVNKSMTLMGVSTITIYDIEQSDNLDKWVEKFVSHFDVIGDDMALSSNKDVVEALDQYVDKHSLPKLKPKFFYGFSKLLLEKLLEKSSNTREGSIYLIRAAVIIGDDIKMRKGNSVVKNIMEAIYMKHPAYEVWNRTNYFTPISNMKDMMMYITTAKGDFSKFEIFDSGCVVMSQHDFATKLINASNRKLNNIKFVEFSDISRKVTMRSDPRLLSYYPTDNDVDQSVVEMVEKYED